MKKKQSAVYWLLLALLTLVLLPAFGRLIHGQTPVPTPDATSTNEIATPTSQNDTLQSEPTATTTEESLLALPSRTPVPTATPGMLQESISDFSARTGLDDVSILGLSAEFWINLLISVLIVIVAYFVVTWMIRGLLRRLARRTPTDFDDRLLAIIGSEIRWLVVLFFLRFAIARLLVINTGLQTILQDLILVAALAVILRIIWRLIGLTQEWFTERLVQDERDQELEPVIRLFGILAKSFAVVVISATLLAHFGFNVTIFAATLGILGLSLSLGARDLVADVLSGITILMDRPFRIGDRIEVMNIDTWGDVTDIGLRTTRILTRDNRMVIVPNSTMANNEVVNYTYPDPTYRFQTHIGVANEADVESVREIITDTVRQLDDVISDQPVEALYVEMDQTATIFRVRWWMDSYNDTRSLLDKVHSSVREALEANGVKIEPTANRVRIVHK